MHLKEKYSFWTQLVRLHSWSLLSWLQACNRSWWIRIYTFGYIHIYNDYELQSQKAIGKELGYAFIRINHDERKFNKFKVINKYIKQSSKKSLIDNISKRLLQLECKSNYWIT